MIILFGSLRILFTRLGGGVEQNIGFRVLSYGHGGKIVIWKRSCIVSTAKSAWKSVNPSGLIFESRLSKKFFENIDTLMLDSHVYRMIIFYSVSCSRSSTLFFVYYSTIKRIILQYIVFYIYCIRKRNSMHYGGKIYLYFSFLF